MTLLLPAEPIYSPPSNIDLPVSLAASVLPCARKLKGLVVIENDAAVVCRASVFRATPLRVH